MSITNLERVKYELERSGFKLDQEEFDYGNECGKAVYELCKVFAEQGHSGYSASITLNLFKKLMIEEGILSPLTNDPEEWMDISEMSNSPLWQSKRDFSCFSDDNLETYYDNDETKNGVKIKHKLKEYTNASN